MRGSPWITIRDDARGFEKFVMVQPANRAMLAVSVQHSLAESRLVRAMAEQPSNITAADFGLGCFSGRPAHSELAVINHETGSEAI
jgi:hypothetical protein